MAQGSQFTLLTQNLWLHYLTRAPNKDHRITHFLKNLGKLNFDVVVLQEVFVLNLFGYSVGDDLREQIIHEAKAHGYMHHTKGDTPPSVFGQTSGLLILSKHPILQGVERRWYKLSDFGTGKGFLHAIIRVHNEDVHIFNVHLDAHYPETRQEQVRELCTKFLPSLNNKIIVAGDFNIATQDVQEYENMLQVVAACGLRDVYEESAAKAMFTHRKGCIDHILVSPNIEVLEKELTDWRDADGAPVSDHCGVCAQLRFAM